MIPVQKPASYKLSFGIATFIILGATYGFGTFGLLYNGPRKPDHELSKICALILRGSFITRHYALPHNDSLIT